MKIILGEDKYIKFLINLYQSFNSMPEDTEYDRNMKLISIIMSDTICEPHIEYLNKKYKNKRVTDRLNHPYYIRYFKSTPLALFAYTFTVNFHMFSFKDLYLTEEYFV
ncbi:membrane protein [Klebsiella phage K64-1]|uniref:membrane protein n=1 Tax=Klebsiella phage K64-1 TaxID=1439894 RepID=UPI00248B56FD|nr:membrane protein [Klebsiella phage K64-1]